MNRVDAGHHRWSWFLVCLLIGALTAAPLASTHASSHDDVDYYDGSQDDTGTTGEPAGNGGSDWTVPAIVAGAAATAMVVNWLRNRHAPNREPTTDSMAEERDMLERLQQEGPTFAPAYNTSAFAAVGMVRGGWPFVLDFTHDRPVMVRIRLSARGLPEIYTLQVPFGADETGSHRLQFWLPPEFGNSERPAAIAVTATAMGGDRPEPSFRITALGCGPRAIGSVAIEEVSFLPRLIRAQAREQASYRFFSHSDFPSAVAEFMRVEPANDGERHFFVNEASIAGGVAAGRSIDTQQWDGRDTTERISTGTHRLKVRAWSPTAGWLTAWSDSRVDVSP
ncbi:hypothetical protein [Halomonas ramblicola]|uniref:hypothetical protein n=1 Tax=Halomonas ramblicola TaxID=747349 RepID=UPI0025B5FE1C|nr:hypothetical protein [Halomonas ramblicola]MDN3523568.1 hypothetical protein [Halomonas ramblicola]